MEPRTEVVVNAPEHPAHVESENLRACLENDAKPNLLFLENIMWSNK